MNPQINLEPIFYHKLQRDFLVEFSPWLLLVDQFWYEASRLAEKIHPAP